MSKIVGEVRLLSLEDRLDRFIADVVFFYKVINDHIRLTLGSRVHFSRDVDRGYELRSMDTSNVLRYHPPSSTLIALMGANTFAFNTYPHKPYIL